MVLVEFDIHQPLNLKDLENISLLYDNDVAMDFNIFINYLNKKQPSSSFQKRGIYVSKRIRYKKHSFIF